jgi:hypothetical protein
MVFNLAMEHLHPDSALIEQLGGPAQVARLLGFEVHGTQRVFNWMRRGIPPAIKLERPDLFLSHLLRTKPRRKSVIAC